MLIAVLSGFIFAACIPVLGRFLKFSIVPALLPIGLFTFFASFLPEIASGKTLYFNYDWVPSLGVNLQFHLDGLAMLFCLLITGIGSLVFLYTSNYLAGHRYLDRFYGYLSMFMGSMLGLVLSDNIIALFIFLSVVLSSSDQFR